MEQESYSSGEERIYVSSLPIDRWVKLALGKLSKGYLLIIGERNAQFFQRGRGYEPCPMPVAKLLVKEAIVVSAGDHERGLAYRLAGDQLKGWSLARQVKVRDEEDEDEIMSAGEDETIEVEDSEDVEDEDDSDDGEGEDLDEEDEDDGDEEEDDPLFG